MQSLYILIFAVNLHLCSSSIFTQLFDVFLQFFEMCFMMIIVNVQDAMEYAECEATVKNYPPFIEAMKKRGVDDMELVMVDAW
jgi:hypothetical protein